MDQINHIGRPCDSELRFCGTALRFLDTTALGSTRWACWQTQATAPPRFPRAWASRWLRQGRRRRARRQSRASVRPGTIRGRDRSGKGRWWMAADGAGAGLRSCCRVRVSFAHSWAGLAGPWLGLGSEAGPMRRGAGSWFWGCRRNGGPRQWCWMVACLRSIWQHF